MSGSDNDGARGAQGQPGEQRFMMEALTGQLRALMREMEGMREEMGEMRAEREQRRNARPRNPAAPRQQRVRPQERWEDVEEDFEEIDYGERGADRRRYEQGRRDNRREDDNLGSIKSKIPEFKGRNDPEAYLEWEKRIENIFDIYHYSDRKKVKLAVTEFTDYALTWWDQIVTNRRRNREPPMESWEDMRLS